MFGSKRQLQARLLRWYQRHRRDLPWRPPLDQPSAHVDPYFVLVSEAMLQQTQVTTVIPYFRRFIAAFPTLQALAAANEQRVLRLWQGLGYYNRARHLHRAAQQIVRDFGGKVPADLQELLRLPGVGRYTAGAVASIAFDLPAPIVDGNVARVLCRLHCIDEDPRSKPTIDRLWALAESLLPTRRVGDFNSALMELGATICTPRTPACLLCPVREHCRAADAGRADRIPPPRRRRVSPLERRVVLVISRLRGSRLEYALEQRPPSGRWASMWQFPSFDASLGEPEQLSTSLGAAKPRRVGLLQHVLTHRRYEFAVYATEMADGVLPAGPVGPRRWVTSAELDRFPLSKPHLRIAQLAGIASAS